jgi:hypothetical protein
LEIVGVTRLKDGKEVNEFVIGCPEHNFWYKGKPPLTTGCRECWNAFYYAQAAQSNDFKGAVDQLESAIRHIAEQDDRGEFDFTPKLEDFKVTHED